MQARTHPPTGSAIQRLRLALLVGLCSLAAIAVSTLTQPRSGDDTADEQQDTGAGSSPAGRGHLSIAFVGDIHFEGAIGERLQRQPEQLLGGYAQILRSADIAVGNLEAAITESGTPEPKAFTFRATPASLEALESLGLDVLSLANNHGMDFGASGLQQTLAARARHRDGLVIGIGGDLDDALRPARFTVAGTSIEIFAATQVLDSSLESSWTATEVKPGLASAKDRGPLVQRVRSSDADVVVVYLHWGAEGEICPSAEQRALAEALVGAGADAVVGGHAHRVQASGWMEDAVVAYGLGNFVFTARSPESSQTGALIIDIEGGAPIAHRWIPGTITDGSPRPFVSGPSDDGPEFERRLACSGLRARR